MIPRGKILVEKLEASELCNIANNYESIRKLSPPRPGTVAHKWDGTVTMGKLLSHILWLEEQVKSIEGVTYYGKAS